MNKVYIVCSEDEDGLEIVDIYNDLTPAMNHLLDLEDTNRQAFSYEVWDVKDKYEKE